LEQEGQPESIQINKKLSSKFSIKKRKYSSSLLSSERMVEGLHFYIYRQEGKIRLSIFLTSVEVASSSIQKAGKNVCVAKKIQDVPSNGKCEVENI
jgi:hypothetical protein